MVLSLLLLPLVGRPAPASWGLLALSVSLHTSYKALLLQSYRVGDLNQVYPLVRGPGRCWSPGSPPSSWVSA